MLDQNQQHLIYILERDIKILLDVSIYLVTKLMCPAIAHCVYLKHV